ncbi:hypothetical protein F511_36033 [Dorcoceras hygrometricum]|uniref:MADS-box domain-containing protein n=1 Tax=Dorcoceras hygrometricum TaxID=472368 RepID=A0A2Z7CKT2_9LAMI|nr:hypothetical protein F511_36033 [Dorcoceras hygrometricum]
MPKKIINHEKITNQRQRDKVYKNRSEGLLKKMNELSILCGIDAAIVIHKRDENNATLWPSSEIYRQRMQKFLNFSSAEREKKMVTHDKYLDQRLLDESRNLLKSRRTNEVLEGELVTDDVTAGTISCEQLNLIHMNNMKVLADDMIEKVDEVISDYQMSEQEQQPPNPRSFVIPPPVPNMSSIEDLLSWPMESGQRHGRSIRFKATIDDGVASSSNVLNISTPPPRKA